MRISCAGTSFDSDFRSDKLTLEGYIDLCADIGLDGLEMTEYYFPETGPAYLNALKRRAFRRGLTVAGAAVGATFAQADPVKRAAQVEEVKQWVEIACRLGAPCLRVFAGSAPEGHSEEDAFGWVVEGLKECASYAERAGVMLALENHGGLTGRAEGVLRIL